MVNMTMQWQIFACSFRPNITCFDPVPIFRQLKSDSRDLFIPGRLLPYGLFRFSFRVHAMERKYSAASKTYQYVPHTKMDNIYIEIVEFDAAANLVVFGTSEITIGRDKNLILDPGQYSVNLNSEPFVAEVSCDRCVFFRQLMIVLI